MARSGTQFSSRPLCATRAGLVDSDARRLGDGRLDEWEEEEEEGGGELGVIVRVSPRSTPPLFSLISRLSLYTTRIFTPFMSRSRKRGADLAAKTLRKKIKINKKGSDALMELDHASTPPPPPVYIGYPPPTDFTMAQFTTPSSP